MTTGVGERKPTGRAAVRRAVARLSAALLLAWRRALYRGKRRECVLLRVQRDALSSLVEYLREENRELRARLLRAEK